jgi:hypothetical protein
MPQTTTQSCPASHRHSTGPGRSGAPADARNVLTPRPPPDPPAALRVKAARTGKEGQGSARGRGGGYLAQRCQPWSPSRPPAASLSAAPPSTSPVSLLLGQQARCGAARTIVDRDLDEADVAGRRNRTRKQIQKLLGGWQRAQPPRHRPAGPRQHTQARHTGRAAASAAHP